MRCFFCLTAFLLIFNTSPAQAQKTSSAAEVAFSLTGINESVVREFQKAWWRSGGGIGGMESLALIVRAPDGSYEAVSGGHTNELRQFSFKWNPDAIAIVHTHPNNRDPKPSFNDTLVGDKLGVPVLTITNRGMYMYDPRTKKITKVKDGLDWIEPSKWAHMVAGK